MVMYMIHTGRCIRYILDILGAPDPWHISYMYVSDIYWACEELSRGDLYQGRYIRHIGDLR